MNIEAQESAINGDLIRLTRESRGWALGDLATRSCMSIRQIRQLEEGGTSSFYSLGVKVTAAKRVATLLGLSPEQVFASSQAHLPSESEPATVSDAKAPSISASLQPDVPLVLVSQNVMVSQAESDALTGVSSHVDEPSDQPTDLSAEVQSAPSESVPTQILDEPVPVVSEQTAAETVTHTELPAAKSKFSFVPILVLFAAALGVAALMRPEAEPVVLESSPPVLVLPETTQADAPTLPASAALMPAESASAAALTAQIKPAQVTASAPAASAATPAAAVLTQPRVAASSASGASVALPAPVASALRPAVTASAAASSASGASSKAP